MVVRRFDVFLVNLDPTGGSEIRKVRPCLIVSPDEMNRHIMVGGVGDRPADRNHRMPIQAHSQ
jgi:mRNA-degrading endonuclease toxin of MazEF toxin-antitoxin module